MTAVRQDRRAEPVGGVQTLTTALADIRSPLSRLGRSLLRHRFAVLFVLTLAALTWTVEQVLASGSLVTFDYTVHYLRFDLRYPQIYPTMFYLVMIGQRGPTAIPAAIVTILIAWRRRSWRPILLFGTSMLALNLIVGAGKFATARLKPADSNAALFDGGTIFPSGHASNVVLTWGIVVYLLVHYGPLRSYRVGAAATAVASLIVGIASIYLDTHWVSDILAGWLVGAAILMATIAFDRRHPPVGGQHRAPVTLLDIPGVRPRSARGRRDRHDEQPAPEPARVAS